MQTHDDPTMGTRYDVQRCYWGGAALLDRPLWSVAPVCVRWESPGCCSHDHDIIRGVLRRALRTRSVSPVPGTREEDYINPQALALTELAELTS